MNYRTLFTIFCLVGFKLHAQPIIQVSSQTYGSGQTTTIRASEAVSTSGSVIVSSGANVTFQAGDIITLSPGFTVQAGGEFKARITANKAQFIRQTVPTQMSSGQVVPVSITLRNNGNQTWTNTVGVKLGSQTPINNTLWTGASRVTLGTDAIAPGETKIFNFTITAPATNGSYSFQWMMVQEGVEWFGEPSPLTTIVVGATSNADTDFDGLPDSYTNDTNGDGVPDSVETALGLNPTQSQPDAAARSKAYEYDDLNRLREGPGRTYDLDAEGNIKAP